MCCKIALRTVFCFVDDKIVLFGVVLQRFWIGSLIFFSHNNFNIFIESAIFDYGVGVVENHFFKVGAARKQVVVQKINHIRYRNKFEAGAVAEAVFVERRHSVGS